MRKKADPNYKYFRLLFRSDVKCRTFPVAVSSAVLIAILILSSVITVVKGELPAFLYAVMYIAIISNAAVSVSASAFTTVSDIKHSPKYKNDPAFSKNASPTSKEFVLSRFLSSFIFSVAAALLYSLCDLSVTMLGGHYYDGYFSAFVSNFILFFSLFFYIASVLITSCAKYDIKKKHPLKSCVFDGILLYALGLIILSAVLLIAAAVPFTSETATDIYESGFSPTSLLIFSAIYFSVSLARTLYLSVLCRKRLERSLKLLKNKIH